MFMNGCMLQGFSWYLVAGGHHWERLERDAKLLADSGVTAVWLPPAYKGQSAEDVGYGVYDMWDLGEFDQKGTVATKYGTKDQYVAAVKALQKAHVNALGDVVFNHRIGGDATEQVLARPVASDNRNEFTGDPETITAQTSFTFPGRGGKYDDFRWDWTCFHGCDYDAATDRHDIFLFDDKHWDRNVNTSENGNYDFLMGCDVDVNNPRVYDQLIKWGKWYLDTTGVDGFRLDATKHISRDFYLRWLAAMREYAGRELFTVGEYWSHDVDELIGYLGDAEMMSLFDVPLHFKFYQASSSFGEMDLSKLFEGTLVAENPIHAVTFVDNHDTQPGQALESTVQAWFKPSAYAIILLRAEGYPCVFYGDLFGMPNDGDIPPVRELPVLMEARRRFAYGEQHDYFDSPDIIGWTREGDPERETSGCAVLLTDKSSSEKTMYVGSRHAGERWICVMGEESAVEVDGDGNATFTVGDGRCSVYLPESAAKVLKSDYRAILRHAKTAVDPQPREGEPADEPLGDLDEHPDAGINVDEQPSEQQQG